MIIPTALRRAGLAWALLLLGMLGAAAAAAAAAATSSPTIPTGDESREILVMLRLREISSAPAIRSL